MLLRRLGTRYTARRTLRLLEKTRRRQALLEAEIRHQLLREKELIQKLQMLEHRQMELGPAISPVFRDFQLLKDSPQPQVEKPRLSPLLQEFLQETQGSNPPT